MHGNSNIKKKAIWLLPYNSDNNNVDSGDDGELLLLLLLLLRRRRRRRRRRRIRKVVITAYIMRRGICICCLASNNRLEWSASPWRNSHYNLNIWIEYDTVWLHLNIGIKIKWKVTLHRALCIRAGIVAFHFIFIPIFKSNQTVSYFIHIFTLQ